MTDSLRQLLHDIEACAAAPLAAARGLPFSAYHSAEFCAWERDHVFRRGWACVGRADEIARSGDYLTWRIGNQPIVSIRQPDGAIKTFANVCLHRGAPLLEGSGHCSHIVCPYHAWRYALDGRLLGAPFMDRAEGFAARALRLPEIRTELWAGWIYATLDAEIAPVAERLAGLAREIDPFQTERCRQVIRRDEVWPTNWKSLAENFMESYHVFQVHPQTLEPSAPTAGIACVPGDEAWCLHYVDAARDKSAFYDQSAQSGARNAERYFDTCVFPAHLFVGGQDMLWWISLDPESSAEVRVRWGIAFGEAVLAGVENRDAWLAETERFFDQVNNEDKGILAGIRRNAEAPLAAAGRLSHFEQPLWEFNRYLARCIAASRA